MRGVEEQPDAEREPEKCADRYPREFRNQVLDFIAANPPRFGVNWACTMDVGIRVANWLVAYNLFRAAGAEFDAEFEAVFARSVYEHAQHIADNLEWTPALAANHYLANIAGLLFAAAHLPRSPRTDAWLGFGAQELVGAVRKQFYEDGTNFEASNGYHRLAAEMVVYTTALVLGLPPERLAALREYDHRLHTVQPPLPPAPVEFYRVPGAGRESPFPEWYFERLQRMAQFVVDTTRQSSHIPQFGDNDSGRFLKLVPAGALPQTPVRQAQGFQPPKGEFPFGVPLGAQNGCAGPNDDGRPAMAAPAGAAPGSQGLWPAWAEDVLDHRHLVAAVNGLFAREDFAAFAGPRYRTETEVVRWLAGGVIVQAAVSAAEPAPDSASGAAAAPSVPGKAAAQGEDRVATGLAREDGCRIINVLPRAPSQSVQLELDRPSVSAYPDFGLWVYRSPRCYLAVRCGGVGQNGNGGHAHNDQLAFVFGLDGRSLIVDRGTAFYTPAPEQRNLFRSTVMHNTLTLDGHEQNPWASGAPGLFTLHDHAHAHPVTVTDTEFIGEHRGFGVTTSRRLEFRMDRVLAVDTCEHPGAKTVSFHLAPGIDARHIGGDTVEIVLQDRGICWLNGDGFWAIEDCPHSSAYGVVQPARTCRLRSAETEIAWAINWG